MSGPDIDYNKLREDGLIYASDQLVDAALIVAGHLNLDDSPAEIIRKHPMLVVETAKLAHLDERAEERRILKEAELDVLREIADSQEVLAGAAMQLVVGELKERWLICHPNHTEAQLKKAMDYYDSMAVKGSGLRYDDK